MHCPYASLTCRPLRRWRSRTLLPRTLLHRGRLTLCMHLWPNRCIVTESTHISCNSVRFRSTVTVHTLPPLPHSGCSFSLLCVPHLHIPWLLLLLLAVRGLPCRCSPARARPGHPWPGANPPALRQRASRFPCIHTTHLQLYSCCPSLATTRCCAEPIGIYTRTRHRVLATCMK